MFSLKIIGLISFSISLLLLILKTLECKNKKVMLIELPFYAFNFVFLNLWFLTTPIDLQDRNINDSVYLYILIFNISLLIFSLVNKNRFEKYSTNNIVEIKSQHKLTLIGFFAICIFFTLLFFQQKGLYILGSNIEESRLQSRAGSGYVLTFITRGLTLAISIATLFYCKRKIPTNIYIMLFFMVVMIQLLTGFRSFAVVTIIICYMTWSYTKRDFNITAVGKIAFSFVAVFFILTYYKFRNDILVGEDTLTVMLDYFNHRVLMELPRAIGICIAYVNQIELQYGKTFLEELITLAPGRQFSLGDKLYMYSFGYRSGAIITPLTPSVIGEALINFSIFGVILSAYVITKLFLLANKYIYRTKRVFLFCFLINISFMFSNSLMLGFGNMITSRIVPLSVMLMMLLIMQFVFKNLKRIN